MLLGILNSQAAGGGAAGAYDLLETINVAGGSTTSVAFDSIPQDYSHLQIRIAAKAVYANNGPFAIKANFNNSSSQYYQLKRLVGNGSNVSSNAGSAGSDMWWGYIPTLQASSEGFGTSVVELLDYTSENKNTTVRVLNGYTNSNNASVSLSSSLWLPTEAITKISFDVDSYPIASGSRFSLYGIK